MKNYLKGFWLAIVFAIAFHGTAHASTETVILKARETVMKRFQFALQREAKIVPTPDNRSFYVLWYPRGVKPGSAIIVTLHGQSGWAFNEFYLWQPFAEQYGLGILALQWWFGEGKSPDDYYTPKEMDSIIRAALKKETTLPGNVLLHGFSRGASNTYALAFLDRSTLNPYFGTIIANSGGLTENYPPNQEILAQGAGALTGTHWVLYCGEKDPNPERDGCPAMRRTRGQLESLGGTIDLLLEDKDAGHGGFHHNASLIFSALEEFKKNNPGV